MTYQTVFPDSPIIPEVSEGIEFPERSIIEPWLEQLPTQSHALIHTWIRALCAYDYGERSPLTYLDLSEVRSERQTFSVDGKLYSANKVSTSELSRRRREFMEHQSPYEPLNRIGLYPERFSPDVCKLCENILQAIDTEESGEPSRNNLILSFRDCVVLPNRYPAELLHSLILPANHDDFSERSQLKGQPTDSGPIFVPEPDKTRDAVVSSEFLGTVIAICDALEWGAVRNHFLDGKSIRDHDHFQTFAFGSHHLDTADEIFPDLPDGTTLKVFVPDTTPFDTLFVVSRDRMMLLDYASPLLERLERGNEVFTVFYLDGRLAISPRRSEPQVVLPLNIGGGIPLHLFDSSNDQVMMDIFRDVPLSERFDWSRYI